jgi:conjugative transfer signal peptidase TraF
MALGTALPLVPLAWKAPTLLVWNASASEPIGLYRVDPRALPRRGAMVVAWPPPAARRLAARRNYLPANVPLVKRVAASAGDRVCAKGGSIRVGARRLAVRKSSDGAGRTMPRWTGCHRLSQSEYLLLADSPDSFDGRYFGITRRKELVGGAVLLWPR